VTTSETPRAKTGRPGQSWQVGALARATGLTVRTLHYYEEIGLLVPAGRSAAGYRLYDTADVARLYRISLLRRLGFPLDQVLSVLDDPQWELAAAVGRHLAETRRRAASATRLSAQLASMAAELARQDIPSAAQLFSTLEEMTMLDATIHSTASMLAYDDTAAAQEYLLRVFGFAAVQAASHTEGSTYREVMAGSQVIGLHPVEEGMTSPRLAGAPTSMTVVTVDDIDAHHARSLAAGADIVDPLADKPWGVREYGARDPQGHLWYFHSARD
jgi:MerR family transcriptional regulator, thiopeptide resistance regulator